MSDMSGLIHRMVRPRRDRPMPRDVESKDEQFVVLAAWNSKNDSTTIFLALVRLKTVIGVSERPPVGGRGITLGFDEVEFI